MAAVTTGSFANQLLGGPFQTVLDIGGNVGDFAELAVQTWPQAAVFSFEPLPHIADANRRRSIGRWQTVERAVSDHPGQATINYCRNQHSASTMRRPGTVRHDDFGIVDRYEQVDVLTLTLDGWAHGRTLAKPVLVKIDVEGHELNVLVAALATLAQADTVVCEVQNDPAVFADSAKVSSVAATLRHAGFDLAGVLDVLRAPDGRIVQFDGVWRRQST